MIAVFLSPIYCIINILLIYVFLRWIGHWSARFRKWPFRILVILVWIFLAVTPSLALYAKKTFMRRVFKLLGNYWFGFEIYIVMVTLALAIIWFILRKIPGVKNAVKAKMFVKIYGLLGFIGIFVICIGGIVNAHNIHVTNYDITVEKDGGKLDDLNIVLVGDLHMGYNIGISMMKQMVHKINAQNPDIVLIAGDVFDNEYQAVEKPEKMKEILSGIKSTYGVYTCWGNHDIEEATLAGFTFKRGDEKQRHPSMAQFLDEANIQILCDESVLIDDSFYVYGRPDREIPNVDGERRTADELLQGLDQNKMIIDLEHEPAELQELADAGVDMDLNGHTHNGQLFPGNITIKFFWENPCGYLKKGNMHNIVTSGVGLYGPFMRVGTIAEICNIHVNFNQ